jgi:hypothetical protein
MQGGGRRLNQCCKLTIGVADEGPVVVGCDPAERKADLVDQADAVQATTVPGLHMMGANSLVVRRASSLSTDEAFDDLLGLAKADAEVLSCRVQGSS